MSTPEGSSSADRQASDAAGVPLDLDLVAAHCYTAVICDVCDRYGRRHQSTESGLFPLTLADTVLVGWARTARAVATTRPPLSPYAEEIRFVDSLRTGDVAVIGGRDSTAACWGELFSTAAASRGARGAIVDGVVRDRARIRSLGFPVFARGVRPTDSYGRITFTEHDQELDVAGVRVRTGDLVVADEDGVVIVPQELVGVVIPTALEKAGLEGRAKRVLREGGYLRDAWEQFGVL